MKKCMKFFIICLAAAVFSVAALASPASAYAHSGGHRGSSACTVADCTMDGSHTHDGVCYYGHSNTNNHKGHHAGNGNGSGSHHNASSSKGHAHH